jgi:hypothetical protein
MSKREAFKKYAAKHAANVGLDAKSIRFVTETGSWRSGPQGDDATIHDGHEFLADVEGLLAGYRKFAKDVSGKTLPPIWAVVRVSDGEEVDRELLGDLDQSRWEPSKFGDGYRDPWAAVSCLPLLAIDDESDGPDVFVFVTETPSGNAAIGGLVDAALARTDPIDELPDHSAPPPNGNGHDQDEMIPRVVLGSRRIAEKRFVPALCVIGWEPRPLTARKLTPPPLPLPPAPKASPQGRFGFGGNDIPF